MVDRIPECPQRKLGCPKETWQCPQQMQDWVNRYLDSEEELTRGKKLLEQVKIISETRPAVETAFNKQDCTLFKKLIWYRIETDYAHRVQKGLDAVDRLRANSKAHSRDHIYK